MSTIFKLGRNCKVYHGAAGDTAETEVTNLIEVNLELTGDEGEFSSRDGGGWKAWSKVMKDANVQIVMHRKATVQAAYDALLASFLNDSPIALLVLDGPVEVADSQGLDADFEVMAMSRPEPLTDGVKITFTCKPCPSTRNPAWHDSTGS
jgi:hypothetical protein